MTQVGGGWGCQLPGRSTYPLNRPSSESLGGLGDPGGWQRLTHPCLYLVEEEKASHVGEWPVHHCFPTDLKPGIEPCGKVEQVPVTTLEDMIWREKGESRVLSKHCGRSKDQDTQNIQIQTQKNKKYI